jgi:hypothetical protein
MAYQEGRLMIRNFGYGWSGVLTLILSTLIFCGPLRAERIGTAVVGGRTVIIDSDGTWSYKEASSVKGKNHCDEMNGLSFCLQALGWRLVPAQPPFKLLYDNAEKYFLGVLNDPNGSDKGINYELLQTAIVSNAARGAESRPEDLPILNSQTEIKGHPGWRLIAFAAEIKGAPFVFHTLYKIYPEKSVQLVFWGLGKTEAKDFTDMIDASIAASKID